MAEQRNNNSTAEDFLACLGNVGSSEAQQALAALAQSQLAVAAQTYPVGSSIFNPLANMYANMTNPMLGATGMNWSGLGTDYLVNMNAWQALQGQSLMSGAVGLTNGNPGITESESFADLLRKMPQPPTCNVVRSPQVSLCQSQQVYINGSTSQEHNSKENIANSKYESVSDNKLATLAAVAEQIQRTAVTQEEDGNEDIEKVFKSSPPRTNSRASDVVLPLKKRPIGYDSSISPQPKIPKQELPLDDTESGTAVKSNDINNEGTSNDISNEEIKEENDSDDNTGDEKPNSVNSLSADVQMNSQLLEASARAWAALSCNQFLMNMQSELLRQQNQNHKQQNTNRRTSSSGRRGGRPRKSLSTVTAHQERAPTVVDNMVNSDGRDSMDDAIDSVLRKTEMDEAHDISQRLMGTMSSSRRGRGRGGKRRRDCGITVREQLAIQRAKTESEASETDEVNGETPLDLSVKPGTSRPTSGDGKVAESRESSSEERSTDTPQYPRKRRVAETDLVRIPLTEGWRRQTCIRSISATGVRGDVIYYAPCGKRLGSYAEVIRYLNKNQIGDIGRDHFSFSCKVLIGEFLQIKTDASSSPSSKNGIQRLTEAQVIDIMEQLSKGSSRSILAHTKRITSSYRSSRGNKRSSRHHNVSVLVYRDHGKSLEVKKVEKENHIRTQKVIEAMRKAKEQQEMRKKQLAFIQTQGEEYYRQMLLVGLEQETIRQHLMVAKTVDNRSRMEDRQRLYAERLIRQEERVAARNAHLNRMKQLRQPTEDLELDDSIRSLPQLTRIAGMQISGQAFADLTMVIEFISNFGHVLKIARKDVPSLSQLHTALLNEPNEIKSLRRITKILLTLVLEYPGLPTGPQGRTFLGQSVKEVGVRRENYNELLKMFLLTRDSQGQKLGKLLENAHFESLDPESKTAILAYMCNELLYCRNVVREIEGNIDEMVRLKGEKWAREGKSRLLRGIQANKNMEANRRKNQTIIDGNNIKGPSYEQKHPREVELKMSESFDHDPGTPASLASVDSDSSECKPIAQILREEQQKKDTSSQSSKEATPAPNDEKEKKKPLPPGSNQLETITEEEKQMTPEQLETVIQELTEEASELRHKVGDTASRVRIQPYGQDRYQRFYWVLPSIECILVEGLESAQRHNPAISPSHRSYTACYNDVSLDPDVVTCVEHMIQKVSSSRSTNKRGRSSVPTAMQKGWWHIWRGEEVDQLQNSLLSRGIRERLMHRSFTKYGHYIKRRGCQNQAPLEIESCGKLLSREEMSLCSLKALLKVVREFEEKVFHANVHCRKWRPPDMDIPIEQQKTDSLVSDNDESSNSSWSSTDSISHELAPKPQTFEELLASIKNRLLNLEKNTERRYLQSPFHFGHSIPAETVLSRFVEVGAANEVKAVTSEESTSSSHHNTGSDDNSSHLNDNKTAPLLQRWRTAVQESRNGDKLMLCLQQLDYNIDWDRSIMRASCQICRSGENESKLLLCDCCDLGYHTYCFRPKMTTIPDGDWFCPACIEKASGKPCCLVCSKQTDNFLTCINCIHSFHEECVDVVRKISKEAAKSWLCPGCSRKAATNTVTERKDSQQSDANNASGKTTKMKGGKMKQIKRQQSQSPKTESSSTTVPSPLHFQQLSNIIMDELDTHKDTWPFKLPVDTKALPLYKKIIRKPMDLSTVKNKLNQNKYENEQQFVDDVRLMFDNCKTFNEDHSPVGKAGHSARRFFNRRWKELKEMDGFTNGKGKPKKSKD